MYVAKCSQCPRRFRRHTRSELLNAIRKHMWKSHATWMRRRIKQGLVKSKDNPHTALSLIRDIITGDIIPGYSGYKRKHYEAVRPVMEAIYRFLPPNIQAGWKLVDAVARRLYIKK